MVNNKVSDQQSFVTEGSDIQQTKFQTVEWCVSGWGWQIERTGGAWGTRPCGLKVTDVCVTVVLSVLKVEVSWSFENVRGAMQAEVRVGGGVL